MIYVLIPSRDEAPTVGLLLWKVRQAFTGFSREYQIIVVNDGSSDASEEVLAPYTRALPLTLLSHREPRGYARSLEELLRAAVQRTDRPRRDLAVTLQADFSDSPEDLVELVKRLEAGADIAVPDRQATTFETRTGRLAHRAVNQLLRGSLGLSKVADLVGTMRAYRLAVIERLIRQFGSSPFVSGERWTADIQLLTRAARHARSIESVPLSSARSHGSRPSRATPLRSAWSAWSAASDLRRELRAPLQVAPAAVEPPPLEEAPRESEPSRERQQRPQRQKSRHQQQQQQQQQQQHQQHQKKHQRRAERAEAKGADAAPPAETPRAAAPAGGEAAADSQSGSSRRRRRRRGRGRGRGRREDGGGNGGNGNTGGNETGSGDSTVSSPSAA